VLDRSISGEDGYIYLHLFGILCSSIQSAKSCQLTNNQTNPTMSEQNQTQLPKPPVEAVGMSRPPSHPLSISPLTAYLTPDTSHSHLLPHSLTLVQD